MVTTNQIRTTDTQKLKKKGKQAYSKENHQPQRNKREERITITPTPYPGKQVKMEIRTYLSTISLNVNGLNARVKT